MQDASVDDIVELCKDGAETWWAGRDAMVPASAWGPLNRIVGSAEAYAEARDKLAYAPQALSMLNALARQAATSSPQTGHMLAGYPVMAKGKLSMSAVLGSTPDDFVTEQERLLAPGGLAVLRFTPHLIDARALTSLSLFELRELSDSLFENPAHLSLYPPPGWVEWEENMLLWLFVVDGSALVPREAPLAASLVTELMKTRLAGNPLLVACRPAQPAARLFMAYDMFRIQKVISKLVGPWPLTITRTGKECQLTWPGGEAFIPVPEIPWSWLVQMLTMKMHTAGGSVVDGTRRADQAGTE